VPTTVDLRRFRRVLGTIAQTEFGASVNVRWANQPYPRAAYPFVVLNIFAGPTPIHLPRVEAHTLPTAVRVAVTGSAAGSERILDVNAHRFHSTEATDTAHRDALLVLLADSDEAITATAVGTTELDLTPSADGGLWRVRTPTAGLTATTLSTADYALTLTRCRLSVSANAHARAGASPEPGEILQQLLDALADESTRMILRAHRIGFSAPLSAGARDLSDIEGAQIEARAQRDLEFWVDARRVRTLTPIETVVVERTG
jgi:hypothetical protein